MDAERPSRYPTDLSDAQWAAVQSVLPPEKRRGAQRRTSLRDVVDAILYRRRSGCPWRLLPHDFPPWRTVYGYDQQWRCDGTWARILRALRGRQAA